MCFVARGICDVYLEYGIHCWDMAAGNSIFVSPLFQFQNVSISFVRQIHPPTSSGFQIQLHWSCVRLEASLLTQLEATLMSCGDEFFAVLPMTSSRNSCRSYRTLITIAKESTSDMVFMTVLRSSFLLLFSVGCWFISPWNLSTVIIKYYRVVLQG